MTLLRRLLTEFPMKACSDCCFSNGGHQFAAASNNAIAVYNTCTCELLGTLRYTQSPSALLMACVSSARISTWAH